MSGVPKEVLYVQKLHFLSLLFTISLLLSVVVWIFLDLNAAILFFVCTGSLSYLITVRKNHFLAPNKAIVAERLATRLNSNELSPRQVALAATQIYYWLGDYDQSTKLLYSFIPCDEPLVYSTLADIHLHQKDISAAEHCLNPLESIEHPLIQWILGKIYLHQRRFATALTHLNTAHVLINTHGFPLIENGLLNNIFMQLSIRSSLLHAIAECYYKLGDFNVARKFRIRGNLYLIDPGLWLRRPNTLTNL